MRKIYLLLAVIIFLAIFLRVYKLDSDPISLFGDEVDVGYQAYSLLKTGNDLYGQHLPVLIHSLSEYRAPLYIYSTVPTIALFGLNEWGVRLPSVFWGIVGIIAIYFLIKKLFNQKVALISSLFLSLSPWHIHYSRGSFEVTMLMAIVTLAVLFFLYGLQQKKWLILSAFLFGLTPYIYSTATLFIPFLLLLLILIHWRTLKLNHTFVLAAGFILILTLLPFINQSLSGKAGERFNLISIFSEKSLLDKVLLSQKEESLPLNLQRFFHNKILIYGQAFTLNYLRAFSPEFLFLSGDPNSRHSIHEMGQLYIFELPLLLLGVWLLLKKAGKEEKLILGWLLIAPVPASLTYDGGFHATRNFLMLPPLILISAIGFNYLISRRNKYIISIFLLISIISVILFLHRYFVHFPKESWRAWHFGFKETMQLVKGSGDNYPRILINNTYEPSLIRFLFWTKYDPQKFQQQFQGDKITKNIIPGFDGFNLGNKYYFGSFNSPFENNLQAGDLFVASSREDITNPQILENQNFKLLKTVNSPTGETIFYLVTKIK